MAKIERTKNASRNIIWGILNRIVTLLLPFITRTVMIYTMGMQYVGLGSLFTSILHVLSFAELGIGSALVFSMYKPIAEENDAKVCALLNLYKKTYRVIGLVILFVGLLIMPFLDRLIAGDVPGNVNIQVLFSIYLVNNLIGYFLFAYKQSLFTASQRIDVISKIGMLLNLGAGIAQILILYTIRNYYLYVAVIPLITLLNNVCLFILSNKAFPQYKCDGVVDKKERKEIEKKVSGMIFQKIGGIVLSSVDTIVISSFLGLTSLALYQNYYYIITALFGFLTVIMQSIIAGVGNSVAVETVEKNFADFKKFNYIYIWIVIWCSTCLLCLYQPFMKIWVGHENMFGYSMVVLFAVYFFVHKWCDMLYVYQEACGIWWETRFVPLSAAIVNLIVNILLIKIIGLPGILVSTIVAVVFIYDTGYAAILFKTYFKPIENGLRKYWLRQVWYIISGILIAAVTMAVCLVIPERSAVITLGINGCICVVLPNLLLFILWRKLPEFSYAKNMFSKIMKKVKRK